MPQFSYSFYTRTHRPRAPAEDIRKNRNEEGMFCASAVAEGEWAKNRHLSFLPMVIHVWLYAPDVTEAKYSIQQRTTRAARSNCSRVEWKS